MPGAHAVSHHRGIARLSFGYPPISPPPPSRAGPAMLVTLQHTSADGANGRPSWRVVALVPAGSTIAPHTWPEHDLGVVRGDRHAAAAAGCLDHRVCLSSPADSPQVEPTKGSSPGGEGGWLSPSNNAATLQRSGRICILRQGRAERDLGWPALLVFVVDQIAALGRRLDAA